MLQEHIPSCFDPDVSRPLVLYRGEDAAEMFVRKLQLFDEYISKPMLLTATELRSFTNTTICHICTKPLGNDKMQDHFVTLQEIIVVLLPTSVI